MRARWGPGDYRVRSQGRKAGGGVLKLGDRHLPISEAPTPPLGSLRRPQAAIARPKRAAPAPPGYGPNFTLAPGIGGPIPLQPSNAEYAGLMHMAYQFWGTIHAQANADADARRERDDARREGDRALEIRRIELEHDAREKERDRAYRLELARIRAGEEEDERDDEEGDEPDAAPGEEPAPGTPEAAAAEAAKVEVLPETILQTIVNAPERLVGAIEKMPEGARSAVYSGLQVLAELGTMAAQKRIDAAKAAFNGAAASAEVS